MRKVTVIILLLVYLFTPAVFLSSNSMTQLNRSMPFKLPEQDINPVDVNVNEMFGASFELIGMVRSVVETHQVPASIVYALIQKESTWYPRAKSPKNANGSRDYGLMQLSSSNFELFTWKYKPRYCYTTMDVYDNVDAGVQYLRDQYKQFGSWEAALAAYNCGPGRYKTGKIPESTKIYVRDVLQMAKTLRGE